MARRNVVDFLLNIQANASGVAGVLNGVTQKLSGLQRAAAAAMTGGARRPPSQGQQPASPQAQSVPQNQVSQALGNIQPYTQRASEALNNVMPQLLADADKIAIYMSQRLPAGVAEATAKMKAMEIAYSSESVKKAMAAIDQKVAAERDATNKVSALIQQKDDLVGKHRRARVNKPKYAADLKVTQKELVNAVKAEERATKERISATKKVEAEISRVVKAAVTANTTARKEEAKEATEQAAKIAQAKKDAEAKAAQMSANYKRNAQAIKATFTAAGNAIKGLGRMVNDAANSVRYVTQGISEAGRALLYSVAIPTGAAITKSISFAVEFEAAMTRVRKTTGLTKDAVAELASFAQEFSQYTPTDQVGIAGYMEQIGQLGVTSINGLQRLAVVSEKLASSTDIDAGSVALSIGRIANAFGYNLNTEQGVKSVEKLSNVINMLENTTASSAGEIITAMEDAAAIGSMLKMPEQQLAAVLATMISAGTEANTAGTQLSRWYTTIIQKTGAFAEIMQGYANETGGVYTDTQSVLDKINTDPVSALTDAIDALYRTGDDERAQKLANFFAVSGQVGGKVAVLAGSYTNLKDAIAAASEEWDHGTSLSDEYNIAVMNTDSHIKALKNNLSMLANTLGSVLLPVITKGTEYAIPIIQMLASSFTKLNKKTQLLVIGIPMLVAVATPVLLLFGQLGHASSLMAMGFITSFGSIARVVTSVGGLLFKTLPGMLGALTTGTGAAAAGAGGLGISLTSLLGPIAAVIGGIAFVIFALHSLQAAGVDIAGFFVKLGDSAVKWGENFSKMIGEGILGGGVKFITKAVSSVAKIIARFFESHSPPETGPLSTIDQWGKSLMATYMEGFALADFGILSDVANTIRRMLDISNVLGEIGEEAIIPALRQAKTEISKLIVTFNETGEVAADVLSNIASNFGSIGKDVQKLIGLWLDYEKIQRRIADLEKAKKKTLWIYDDEIAKISQMNISAEQKAELMRQAMYNRDQELRAIEKQLKLEEENAAVAKEKLDWQKAFVDAQLDDLEMMKEIKGAVESVANIIDGLSFETPDTSEFQSDVEKLTGYFNDLQENIGKAKDNLQYFLKGFKGEELSTQDKYEMKDKSPEDFDDATRLYELGKQAGELWKTLSNINDMLSTGPLGALIFGSDDSEKKGSVLDGIFGGEGGGGAQNETIARLAASFNDLSIAMGKILVAVGPPLLSLFALLLGIIAPLLIMVLDLSAAFTSGLSIVGDFAEHISGMFGGIIEILQGLFGEDKSKVFGGISKFLENMWGLFEDVAVKLNTFIIDAIFILAVGVWDALGEIISGVVTLFAGEEAGDAVRDWFDKGIAWIKDLWAKLKGWLIPEIENLFSFVDGMTEALSDFSVAYEQEGWKGVWEKLTAPKGQGKVRSAPANKDHNLATGGIATGPTNVLIGEGGEPEIVSPLSKLPALFSDLYGDAAFPRGNSGQAFTININNPTVRNDQDIERIARQVERALSRKASNSMRLGTT